MLPSFNCNSDSALSDFDGAYDDAKSGMTKSLVLLGGGYGVLFNETETLLSFLDSIN